MSEIKKVVVDPSFMMIIWFLIFTLWFYSITDKQKQTNEKLDTLIKLQQIIIDKETENVWK